VEMGYQIEWDAAVDSLSKMHKRGIRVLPGGDYGFAFTPHCQNARDLEFFVKYLGFTPMEAIRATTLFGGQIMMQGNELGAVKDGYLADLMLVDGDPLANLSILRDPKRILAVMKDGEFAKQPDFSSQQAYRRAA
jgi:imidazolonepropionase-like amidohydrolase